MNYSLFKNLLDRPIAFQRSFVELGAGITGALLLSQMCYWSDRTRKEGKWFYKTLEEWKAETGMTRSEMESARTKLKRLGVIEYQLRGVPAKCHYRVDFDALYSRLQESCKLDCDNPASSDAEILQTITETTAETTTERKTKGPAKPGPTLIDTYLKNQKAKNEPALPANCAAIKHAEKIGLPDHYLLIAWREFVERMRNKKKRQKDWPMTFLNYIRSDFMRLWAINREGEYYLTTAGKTAARAHEVEHD